MSSSRRCSKLYPKCCIQWEDFANINAVPILERYRNEVCTFNDDIQGTAGGGLAGILASLRLTKQKITDQRFLFLGAGSAGTGIAELISQAMAKAGMDIHEARRGNALSMVAVQHYENIGISLLEDGIVTSAEA